MTSAEHETYLRQVTADDVAIDDAIRALVAQAGRSPVSLEDVWKAAGEADPYLHTAVDKRERLAASLDRLTEASVVKAPKNALDRSGLPNLPLRIRTAAPPTPKRARVDLPADLRPELAAARDIPRLRPEELEVLLRVNEFLREWDDERPELPMRERSLELFEDEKRIEELARHRLFRDGALSHPLLHCFPVHPPFVFERLDDGPVALVVENHHTYHSLLHSLRGDLRGVDVIAYGAGNAFTGSASYLTDLEPRIDNAWYFGDVDAEGLQIPQRASLTAHAANAPPLRPAGPLYDELFRLDVTTPAKPCDPVVADTATAWLPPHLRRRAFDLLTSGQRLPQEAVSREQIDRLQHLV